jgi:site-specific DNA-cytosine methylase
MRVLELFKGTGSIEKAFNSIDKNIEVISLDIDKRFNPTHLCDILEFDYKQYPNNHFDIIWGSPPCNCFSHLRNTWIGRTFKDGRYVTKELLEEDIKNIGLPPLYKLQEIINYFKPKYYFIENPATGKMKNYIDDNFLYNINKYIVSYCKYGFDYKKNTAIWTNLKGFNPKICKNDCDSIITIPTNGGIHTGYKIPIKSKTRSLHISNIGDSLKTKSINRHLEKNNIKRKHITDINKLGGDKSFKNKCIKYRIPQPLLIELFNLAMQDYQL